VRCDDAFVTSGESNGLQENFITGSTSVIRPCVRCQALRSDKVLMPNPTKFFQSETASGGRVPRNMEPIVPFRKRLDAVIFLIFS
jgi:hypothetical protein